MREPADGAPFPHMACLSLVRSFSQSGRRQLFDYFLVLDVEATCDAADKKVVNEIIEFPVLLVSGQTLEELSCFRQFVKPRISPVLSDFCIKLTGITQETVDASQPLPRVWNMFQKWLLDHELVVMSEREGVKSVKNLAFVTCGNWASDR